MNPTTGSPEKIDPASASPDWATRMPDSQGPLLMPSPDVCTCGYSWPQEKPRDPRQKCPQCGRERERTRPADKSTRADTPANDPWVTRSQAGEEFSSDSELPTFPGYTILEELGRGGMGVVYRAREEALNRPVALKVLLSGIHASARDLARFRAEAESAASLQHPNVVQVYAYGKHNGFPYIVLELMPGGSLQNRLESGAMSVPRAVGTVRQIALGVQAAHERGVVHRDLKPANVLFALTGEPKVADFGLAKVGDSGLTATGAIMGTPAYMAPEQARGDTKAAGPAADIWALGTILYECLSGRPPFQGQSAPETLRPVCESEPPTLRHLPVDLATILHKCLEKDPGRRYATASAVADDLGRFLAGEPVLARPRAWPSRLARWVSRRQGPVFLLAGAMLALVIMLVLWPGKKPPEVEPFEDPLEANEPIDGPDTDYRKEEARKLAAADHLRHIALAMKELAAISDSIPPDAIYDPAAGKPLLSWRVAYLPFLGDEEAHLFRQFHLDEPWDSPHNKGLIGRMPRVYSIPGVQTPPGETYFQKFTGPGTLFDPARYQTGGKHGKKGLALDLITDGTTFTLLMAEASQSIVWTKPEDIQVRENQPLLPKLGGHFEGGFHVAMADGQVLFVNRHVGESTLRAMLTPDGGEDLRRELPKSPMKK